MLLKTWDAVSTLDRMFDDVMGSTLGTATNSRSFVPDIDVRTNDNGVLVICDVPGLRREDIDVVLESHVLTSKGTRKFENRENEQIMLGRSYGSFAASSRFPTRSTRRTFPRVLRTGYSPYPFRGNRSQSRSRFRSATARRRSS
jgi:HSP20 family molecular chaperone IbpA